MTKIYIFSLFILDFYLLVYTATVGLDALVIICYSVGIYTDNELGAMVDRMESAKLRTVNLTDNDLAKDHLRYFVRHLSHS